MNRHATAAAMLLAALLVACHKKEKTEDVGSAAATTPPPATVPAPASAPAATPAEPTPEQAELAKKKALLDYATMEDKYLNDARAQWATEAKASSVFGGDFSNKKPGSPNMPDLVTGAADGREWTNNETDKGFDWLELSFAKPVNATEVRVVIPQGQGLEAITKLELQDTDGKWATVWDGINADKRDARGNRTWLVRTFDKTAYKAKGVKLTWANNLKHDYKVVDAVQLVGD
jgi:hypothetical protein